MAAALMLGGCAGLGETARFAAPSPPFEPAAFFAGASHGEARLKILFRAPQRVTVDSLGRVGADGVLLLDQRIRQGDAPVRERRWRIRPDGPGRYVGSLTDAEGPVTGEVEGNRLHLHFRTHGGLDMEQWLFLEPGGQVAHNRMVVRKLGLTVAVLDEVIRRAPPSSEPAAHR